MTIFPATAPFLPTRISASKAAAARPITRAAALGVGGLPRPRRLLKRFGFPPLRRPWKAFAVRNNIAAAPLSARAGVAAAKVAMRVKENSVAHVPAG